MHRPLFQGRKCTIFSRNAIYLPHYTSPVPKTFAVSRVNIRSYKVMHRPLKRNHASLLAKRIWGPTLHYALRKLSVRKIHSCFTVYFEKFINHSFLTRIYMQQLCWVRTDQADKLLFRAGRTNNYLGDVSNEALTSFYSPSSHIFPRVLLLHKIEPAVLNLFTLFSNCFRVWK